MSPGSFWVRFHFPVQRKYNLVCVGHNRYPQLFLLEYEFTFRNQSYHLWWKQQAQRNFKRTAEMPAQMSSIYKISTSRNLYPGFFFFSFCCAGSLLLQVDCLWLQRARAFLHCSAMASHCSSFSCCRAQALGPGGSVVWLLRAYLPLGMWNSLRPWIEPVSLTVTGRFLTVGPPGKF